MKLSKHRTASRFGFSMTPMIDIVFLLIIFFMSVSQITRVTDHPLALPRVSEGDQKSTTATVTINLNQRGQIIIAGNSLSLAQTMTAMQNQIRKMDNNPDRIMIQLRCDRQCACEHVNKLLQSLADLGFTQVVSAVTGG